MLKYFCFVLLLPSIYGTWTSRSSLVGFTDYYRTVMQMTLFELEERGFSTLKIPDITRTINLQMYKWHVNGTVTYANGFLNSIQKVYLQNEQQLFGEQVIDNVTYTVATVRGNLHLSDVMVGFDVVANLTDGVHLSTAEYIYPAVDIHIRIVKNIQLGTMECSGTLSSLAANRVVPISYWPSNHVTEVLSRQFTASDSWAGIVGWITNSIVPIVLDITTNKVDFPDICLDCN